MRRSGSCLTPADGWMSGGGAGGRGGGKGRVEEKERPVPKEEVMKMEEEKAKREEEKKEEERENKERSEEEWKLDDEKEVGLEGVEVLESFCSSLTSLPRKIHPLVFTVPGRRYRGRP